MSTPIATFTDVEFPEIQIQVSICRTGYAVSLYDADANESFPSVLMFNNKALAMAKAQEIAEHNGSHRIEVTL